MIRSIIRYTAFSFRTITKVKVRLMLAIEWKRFTIGYRNFLACKDQPVDSRQRLTALYGAVEWLLRAQYYTEDYGFGSFKLGLTWTSSYPETTGYIVETLIKYSNLKKENEIKNCCVRAADWLIEIQKPSGGWQGETLEDNKDEVVFNTGQIIRGLLSVYCETDDSKILKSAIKAGNWLVEIQEANGSWVKHAFMGVARVYDSYVDVPLIHLSTITKDTKYREAAIKNLNWIIENKQNSNGWFQDCDNTIKHNDKPILHTICYTIDGLIESGILLNEPKFIKAGKIAADALNDFYQKHSLLKGRFDSKWNGTEYPILTGYAQLAVVWMKLHQLYPNEHYFKDAQSLNNQLSWLQLDDSRFNIINGGIAGSFPIWGKYETFTFPNWATKYFVDSLMMELQIMKQSL